MEKVANLVTNSKIRMVTFHQCHPGRQTSAAVQIVHYRNLFWCYEENIN